MSLTTEHRAPEQSFAAVYAEVQQFYAHHMFLLDTGAAEEWAAGFTEDGTFAPPSAPQPIQGHETLIAGVRAAKAELAELGEQHRHLLLSLDVTPNPDDTITVRSYAQIVATPRDGHPRIHLMCVTHDTLVREGGTLLIKSRRVTRDDKP